MSILGFGLFKVGINSFISHTADLMLTALHSNLGLGKEQLLAGCRRSVEFSERNSIESRVDVIAR